MLLSDSVLSCDSLLLLLLLSEVVSLSDSLSDDSESEDEVSEELDDESLPELVLALRALNENNAGVQLNFIYTFSFLAPLYFFPSLTHWQI